MAYAEEFAGCTGRCPTEAHLLVGPLTYLPQTVSCDGHQQQLCLQQMAELAFMAIRQAWASAYLSTSQAVPLRLHADKGKVDISGCVTLYN